MQRYPKPDKPEDFESKMRPLRDKLRRVLNENGGASGLFKKKPWGRYKDDLCRAQSGKCGYCDARVESVGFGDVEHFRPKSAVTTLDCRAAGSRGRPIGCRPGDRKTRVVCKPGYWWLAFSWRNYLYACERCNRQWKSTLFPVRNERQRAKRGVARGCREAPLLLHPYEGCGRDPAKHLVYRPDGTVEPRNDSDLGRATIWVCGLNRDGLREDRGRKTRIALQLLDELQRARSTTQTLKVLRGFREAGQEHLPFSGVVRTVFEQNTGLSWNDLAVLESNAKATS